MGIYIALIIVLLIADIVSVTIIWKLCNIVSNDKKIIRLNTETIEYDNKLIEYDDDLIENMRKKIEEIKAQ